MVKALLNLTDGQIDHLKEMLYDDTQTDAMNGLMSRAIYEELERAVSLAGIEESVNRPRGHRWCGPPLQTTEKAVRVQYYSHDLWLPKGSVRLVDGQITAPLHAIDAAKAWNRENRNAN